MLIHERLRPGHPYPQITDFPTNYADFLEIFHDGQTVDNNMLLTTADTPQTAIYKAALSSGHLTKKVNPIQGEFLLDIFLTEAGTHHLVSVRDREFCQLAVELAQKSVAEDDRLHPYVGVVIVKHGKILATGYRGETGHGDHGEYCALKKLSEADVEGATVYTTLEPCSKRKPGKTPCAKRLIDSRVARVVFGMADKDKDVYGHSSLAEAGIEIGVFPKDLTKELVALNKKWSDSRRSDRIVPPNDTNPVAYAYYHKPGSSLSDNICLYVRPPKEADGVYTIEDAAKNVLAYGNLEEIGVEWRRIDTEKQLVEKLNRDAHGNSSGNRLLNFS